MCWNNMQVWSSPNLQSLGRACSEAIGHPFERHPDRYSDMDRAASMDGPYKQYPPPGEPSVIGDFLSLQVASSAHTRCICIVLWSCSLMGLWHANAWSLSITPTSFQ